jgi:hypothetical protein
MLNRKDSKSNFLAGGIGQDRLERMAKQSGISVTSATEDLVGILLSPGGGTPAVDRSFRGFMIELLNNHVALAHNKLR